MEVACIPFTETGYFSKLICDYLDEKEELKPFYNRFPSIDQFKDQIAEKAKSYPKQHRKVLSNSILSQYDGVSISNKTSKQISLLKEENTFTVVTGHQLNLFTGPIYFLYKIISTINLTKELKTAYPEYNFVPVYWMATEDHDFEEINYFNFGGKKIRWNSDQKGPVGRFRTTGLENLLAVVKSAFGNSINGVNLSLLFEKAYLGHSNLADATRFLVNELFESYGLVVVDGDSQDLKRLLIPYVKKDIFENLPYEEITKTNQQLRKVDDTYKIQVNPREINYFYIKDGFRERITVEDKKYVAQNSDILFSQEELLEEIENFPERFSPNVIARPLYQEVILPNLCYIGGGGELAYWFELKSYFEKLRVTYPILLLRNSTLLIKEKQLKKLDKLNLSLLDLFLDQNQLINKKIRKISNINLDFTPQRDHLIKQFEELYNVAEQTEKSFYGAVKAQEIKQLKGLDVLEKRLLKAQKRKLKDHVLRVTDLQNEMFPDQSLQERNINFSEFYLEWGNDLISDLFQHLRPLKQQFLVGIV